MSGSKARLEDATSLSMTNEAAATVAATNGLRRQPTKYPHGLNITVQTLANKHADADDVAADADADVDAMAAFDDYSRASTLRSDVTACWSETQKYKINMMGSSETLAELQVRRYKYPLTANYYLNAAAGGAGGGGGGGVGGQKPTPRLLLAYVRHACRWKYMRWPIIFLASVLLFFGLITYCLWLHDVSVARARYLQRRFEASSTTTSRPATTTTTSTMEHDAEMQRLQQQQQQQSSTEPTLELSVEDEDYDDALQPADSIRFTSGHQNSFGVPIEHDTRMLQLLKDLLSKQTTTTSPTTTTTTPASNVRPLTRVSPTLPPPSPAGGKPTASMTTTMSSSAAGGGGNNGNGNNGNSGLCYSTTLPMCRGVLDYDLTYNESAAPRDSLAMAAYEQLINANCSARSVEFICAALEPECRPSHIGQLPPCRRICKAILEACSIVIAGSDPLTELFDCNLYPDAHEVNKCEDPTRRRDYCYDNEFECEDGSCIPQQWQCDNIKDCTGGEDEVQCLVCEQQDEFRCRSNEKCVPDSVRCDLNFDCFDGSDEEDCDDYGSGETAPFDEAELNAFPRIFSYASFLSPNQTDEKLYTYITATTDEEAGTETKYQVHRVAAPNTNSTVDETPAPGAPKGFVNFRDSKEIMMTSDSENKFKYSAQRANRTSSKFSISSTPLRTAASAQAQQRVVASTVATPTRTSTSHRTLKTCAPHELRCVSGKCITVSQLCDKQIDCPDAADELMCVYRDRLNARRGLNATTTSSSTTTTPATTTSTTTTTTTRRTVRTTINRSRKPKT
ncbi:mucin-5AC [Scaptodrosophila lebanonensis]|uniref:Mucin-5AC n=1 Tax=Drosophila lebanonensis TaxID=7225 RepID=A0A6J2U8E8_DROLE|nr:mucin-5AC [Scaptodrosophila lebanonensis]